jgi:TetR/AcrR family transcriptional regulator
MVSPHEVRRSSRDRLLSAAAAEFAAKGFDGAKVDRIAARARVNKAMVYYHFTNKAALYRAILGEMFAAVAESVESVRQTGGQPDQQLTRFIEAVAQNAIARPYFPPMWLREVAEGGRHLDDAVVIQMRRVIGTLSAILEDGRKAGLFREVNPLVIQVSIVAPLIMFAAAGPLRERYQHLVPRAPQGRAPVDELIAHVQTTALAGLAVNGRLAASHQTSRTSRRRDRL